MSTPDPFRYGSPISDRYHCRRTRNRWRYALIEIGAWALIGGVILITIHLIRS